MKARAGIVQGDLRLCDLRFGNPQCDTRLFLGVSWVIDPISPIPPEGRPIALTLIIDLQIQPGALKTRDFDIDEFVE